jgi:murein L,D-transpeptidase YafK
MMHPPEKISPTIILPILLIYFCGFQPLAAGQMSYYFANLSADSTDNVFLVDKANQALFVLTSNAPGMIQVLDTFRITTGKLAGDKEKEGDFKTPEGIYEISSMIQGNQLSPKYGPMAFTLNYPNFVDRLKGRDGSNIWIHGRDEEIIDRQTKGCISLENGNLLRLSHYIQLQKTQVIIIDSLNHQDCRADSEKFGLTDSLFHRWLKAWEEGDAETYASLYSTKFTTQSWRRLVNYLHYKKQLDDSYAWKKIEAEKVWLMQSDPEAHIYFQQNYLCPNFYTEGIKQLIFIWADSTWKIVTENFTASTPRYSVETAVRTCLDSWKRDWEIGDIERFIQHYDSTFSAPDYARLADYYQYKKNIFDKTPKIKVKIADLNITSSKPLEWQVTFTQDYTTTNYHDHGKKTLLLTGHPKDPKSFKIQKETWDAIK